MEEEVQGTEGGEEKSENKSGEMMDIEEAKFSCNHLNELDLLVENIEQEGTLSSWVIKSFIEHLASLRGLAEKDIPLSKGDVCYLESKGWKISSPDYAYVPDDEDGQMASGTEVIHRLIRNFKRIDAGIPTRL